MGLPERLRELADEAEAMEARLMPEGMEWPRFDDGEPVRIGDEFMGKDGKTYTVKQVQLIGKCFSLYDFCDRKPQLNAFYGERVKRPAPKVLDADGAEIEVGKTRYGLSDGAAWLVTGFNGSKTHPVIASNASKGERELRPEWLTKRAPVLAADGKPLREGETVYDADREGRESIVIRLNVPDKVFNGRFSVLCRDVGNGCDYQHDPSKLTHERLDAWDRIMADAKSIDRAIRGFCGDANVCGDLVRRAKALAGVSER